MDREEARKELQEIDTELIYWEIYNDLNCNTKMMKLIEEKYPHFLEWKAKGYPKEGTKVRELRQEHTCKCNCHKKQKRKDKYKDIIEYIKLYTQAYYKYMQPNTTVEEMKPLNDTLDKWLEEEV